MTTAPLLFETFTWIRRVSYRLNWNCTRIKVVSRVDCALRFSIWESKESAINGSTHLRGFVDDDACIRCTHTCARLRAQTCRGGIDPLCRAASSTPAPSSTLLVRSFVSFLGAAIKTPTFRRASCPSDFITVLFSRREYRSNLPTSQPDVHRPTMLSPSASFPLPLRLLATWMNSRCNRERKPTTNKREKRAANTWTRQYSREYRCSILRSIGKVLGKLREEPNS